MWIYCKICRGPIVSLDREIAEKVQLKEVCLGCRRCLENEVVKKVMGDWRKIDWTKERAIWREELWKKYQGEIEEL